MKNRRELGLFALAFAALLHRGHPGRDIPDEHHRVSPSRDQPLPIGRDVQPTRDGHMTLKNSLWLRTTAGACRGSREVKNSNSGVHRRGDELHLLFPDDRRGVEGIVECERAYHSAMAFE